DYFCSSFASSITLLF
nr:immunoglobulin light chain junction region [Macaca mulatta]